MTQVTRAPKLGLVYRAAVLVAVHNREDCWTAELVVAGMPRLQQAMVWGAREKGGHMVVIST
jgi:hypothetical protein